MNINIILCVLITIASSLTYAGECDTTRTARQMIKAIIAIEDTRGVNAIYGGTSVITSDATLVKVETHYQAKKDSYEIAIRNSDCRILETKLVKENLPL